jgi:tRNA dimethylallyltransferase
MAHPPPFYVVGATATGKTSLAAALAAEFDAEIIGADAFQIYRELPILTVQPTHEERLGVPHHLIGKRSVSEPWDAAQFAEEANALLDEIALRGRRTIIAGGTAFYVRALLTGFTTPGPASDEMRNYVRSLSAEQALAALDQADPKARTLIDIHNPRRVARALEIVLQTGAPLSATRTPNTSPIPGHGILLLRQKEDLHLRIDQRTRLLFERGVEAEVAALPPACSSTASQTLGLKEVQRVLSGELSKEKAIGAIALQTRQLAKRQNTFFKNKFSFTPLEATDKDSKILLEEARMAYVSYLRLVESFPPADP